jgi:hypothetical protein
MHSAVTHARSQVPRFGRARSQRTSRASGAAQRARHDFPAGARPSPSVVDQLEPLRPHAPAPGRRPSPRAGPNR